ncbi:tripartite tricarboxylate transporter family receptor [Bordetella bronchiseptica SBL-F6116]|uniref:Bug family tripartite tricarboxylate transporter substrate binding protein n=1 Tax=Bordetella bronchiseptica TaxID=518 RepID=UPI00045B4EEC|nr:tripartite tricarboxylate transporter substrate binding protein [Bordetella bronchiseptica]KCV30455.1 tripartite tricarboxylate transporter family receptor [Bordetella bronchiseptica 00-P-2730]KDD98966.1 tripartite tricarboxylate transporter family receptor [Bordetella bronchiseptica SBL-F6116]
MKIRFKTLVTAGWLGALAFGTAVAQGGYPNQPIRLLVGYSPGGSVDIVAREYAQHLGRLLDQSVVVENRGGASGTIAAQAVARAPADGYTLFFTASPTVTITPALQKTSFDPVKDFQPVASVVSYTNVLLVNAQAPYRDIQALVAAAKADPGKLTYGSAGVGASNHLSGKLFEDNADIKLSHVPYKGNAPAQSDLIADRITMLFDLNTTAKSLVESGRVKALAVTSGQRNPMFKDVPTMAEAGYPNFIFDGWLGILAPAGTPEAVVKTLADATRKILADKAFSERMQASGYTITASSPQELGATVAREGKQFQDLAERANLRQF